MKTFNMIIISALVLYGFAACGKKGEPDTSKFADACARVVQCDAGFASVPDGQNNCQKFMAALEGKLPNVIPQFQDCLMNTPCEELSFQACGSKHMHEVEGVVK
jgi:predicted small lipoprotein YifL